MGQPIEIKIVSTFDAQGMNEATESMNKLGERYKQVIGKSFGDTSGTGSRAVTNFGKNLNNMLGNPKLGTESAKAYADSFMKSLGISLGGSGKSVEQIKSIFTSFNNEINKAFGTNGGMENPIIGNVNQYLQDSISSMQVYSTTANDMARSNEQVAASTAKVQTNLEKHDITLGSVIKRVALYRVANIAVVQSLRAVFNLMKSSAEVAAEAEQKWNKLNTVFSGVEASATSLAKTLSTKLGVAGSTSASALSTIGDLLQAQGMSTAESLEKAAEWAEQLYDIINFKDLDVTLEEFASNFMAGAAGNTRNFRSFGSIVKETAVNVELAKRGLAGLTGEELELEKMTIRAEMALQQQANAIGATEREWDTVLSINRRLNEATKTWKENLGDSVNKALLPIKKLWTDILEKVNAVNEITSGMFSSDTSVVEYGSYDPTDKEQKSLFKIAVENAVTKSLNGDTQTVVESFTGSGVAEISRVTGATLEQILDYIEKQYKFTLQSDYKRDDLIKDAQRSLDATALENQRGEYKAELEGLVDSYDNMMDSIAGINGLAGFNSEDMSFVPDVYTAKFNKDLDKSFKDGANIITKSITDAFTSAADILGSGGLDIFQTPIEKALGEYDEADLVAKQISAYKDLYAQTYNGFLKNGGIDEGRQTILDGIVEKVKEAKDRLDEIEAETQFLEEKAAWETKQNAKWDSLNPFKEYADIFAENKKFDEDGGFWKSIEDIFINLLSQTEVMAQAMSFVEDTIVPILDAVMRPLIPVLDFLKETIFTSAFMEGLMWVFKVVAEAIVTIVGITKLILQAVTFQWGKMDETLASMKETQDKIWDIAYQIEDNTSDKLDSGYAEAIKEMMDAGFISYAEGMGLIANYTGSRTSLPSSGIVGLGGGDSHDTYNISINGTNMSFDEIFRRLIEEINKRDATGGTITSYANGI